MGTLTRALALFAASALLAAALVGGMFLKRWMDDDGIQVLGARWASPAVPLGHAVHLEATVELPWHWAFPSAPTCSTPPGLVPVVGGASATPGPYTLGGLRTWRLSLPVVAVDGSLDEGERISVSLVPGRPEAAGSVALLVPALEVESPDVGADDRLLAESEPLDLGAVAEPAQPSPERRSPVPWGELALLLALCAAATFGIARLLRRRHLDPVQRALTDLERLERRGGIGTPEFLGRVMDILKRYADERFGVTARAATNTELLGALRALPGLDGDCRDGLAWLTRTDSAVRFARCRVGDHERGVAAEILRSFIGRTAAAAGSLSKTPDPREDSDARVA